MHKSTNLPDSSTDTAGVSFEATWPVSLPALPRPKDLTAPVERPWEELRQIADRLSDFTIGATVRLAFDTGEKISGSLVYSPDENNHSIVMHGRILDLRKDKERDIPFNLTRIVGIDIGSTKKFETLQEHFDVSVLQQRNSETFSKTIKVPDFPRSLSVILSDGKVTKIQAEGALAGRIIVEDASWVLSYTRRLGDVVKRSVLEFSGKGKEQSATILELATQLLRADRKLEPYLESPKLALSGSTNLQTFGDIKLDQEIRQLRALGTKLGSDFAVTLRDGAPFAQKGVVRQTGILAEFREFVTDGTENREHSAGVVSSNKFDVENASWLIQFCSRIQRSAEVQTLRLVVNLGSNMEGAQAELMKKVLLPWSARSRNVRL